MVVTETKKLCAQPLAKAALEGAARDHRKRRNKIQFAIAAVYLCMIWRQGFKSDTQNNVG